MNDSHNDTRLPGAKSTRSIAITALLLMMVYALPARAELGGGSSSTKSINDPLKVRGQTRNLNMMLVLKSKEDRIKFIKIRRDYRKEILATQY